MKKVVITFIAIVSLGISAHFVFAGGPGSTCLTNEDCNDGLTCFRIYPSDPTGVCVTGFKPIRVIGGTYKPVFDRDAGSYIERLCLDASTAHCQ